MKTLSELVSEAISDFARVVASAHAEFPTDRITVEILAKPHKLQRTLMTGHMAVYAFFLNGQALKVGKVGPRSVARYRYQHYNPGSAGSTLAKSILTDATRVDAVGIDSKSVGDWIRMHTDRVNLVVPVATSLPILSLLESFLHLRWKPLFEGRSESD